MITSGSTGNSLPLPRDAMERSILRTYQSNILMDSQDAAAKSRIVRYEYDAHLIPFGTYRSRPCDEAI